MRASWSLCSFCARLLSRGAESWKAGSVGRIACGCRRRRERPLLFFPLEYAGAFCGVSVCVLCNCLFFGEASSLLETTTAAWGPSWARKHGKRFLVWLFFHFPYFFTRDRLKIRLSFLCCGTTQDLRAFGSSALQCRAVPRSAAQCRAVPCRGCQRRRGEREGTWQKKMSLDTTMHCLFFFALKAKIQKAKAKSEKSEKSLRGAGGAGRPSLVPLRLSLPVPPNEARA